MKRWVGLVGAALVIAVAVAAFAPASLADRRLATLTQGKLRIADAHGSLWNGRGVLLAGAVRIPIAWRLAWQPLTRGIVEVTLERDPGATAMAEGTLRIAADRLDAEGVAATVPAVALFAAADRALPAAGGEVSFRAAALRLARNGSEGSLDAEWQRARVAIGSNQTLDFGTVTLHLAVRGQSLAGPITSIGGPVKLDGELILGGTTPGLRATLSPTPSASADIHKALAALGTPDARGAVALRVDRGAF